MTRGRRSISVFTSSLLMAAVSYGQAPGTAGISGQVVDQQGGVLQDAAVILLNSAGVRLQETKTGQNGDFAFRNLAPGEYVVEAEGWASHTQNKESHSLWDRRKHTFPSG